MGFFLVSGLLLFPRDAVLLGHVQEPQTAFLYKMEKVLDVVGDFYVFNLGVTLILLVAAYLRKDGTLRRAALTFLLAGLLCGVVVNVVRPTAGRARPKYVQEDNLHWVTFKGPVLDDRYHSYFSGHTITAWGGAVALALLFPRVGWIAVVFAASVAWARMYGNKHFPSDVAHGAAAGIACAWLVASGMVREWRRMGEEEGMAEVDGSQVA